MNSARTSGLLRPSQRRRRFCVVITKSKTTVLVIVQLKSYRLKLCKDDGRIWCLMIKLCSS